jgi:polyferredoxin
MHGTIYQGKLKTVCVPFLNCYSCPGALGSCPIGAWQSLAAGFSRTASLYVLGIVTAVGALGGRLVCGWLCPFGLIQELLSRLSRWRLQIPRWLLPGKYVMLVLTVLLPFYWRGATGLAEPYFCKYVCPAGTLEGGIPLVSMNPQLAALTGWLFDWKVLLLAFFLLWSVVSWRPFCRTACPLGAFYGLLNRLSIWRLRIEQSACTHCAACSRQCPAGLHPEQDQNSPECVRCLQCVGSCPQGALTFSRQAEKRSRGTRERRIARPIRPQTPGGKPNIPR